jgi:peptidoglycan LD-endopeptidase LytH
MSEASRGSSLRRLRSAATGALFFMLVVSPLGPAPAGAQSTQEELNRARKAVERLEDDVKAARERIAQVRADIQSLTAQVSQATTQVEALGAAKEEAQEQIARAERQAARLQEDLNERAHDAYIQGPAGALELVLGAESLTDLSDRISLLEVLSEGDVDVAAGVDVRRLEIVQLRRDLAEYEEQYQQQLANLVGQQEALQAKYDEETAARAALEKKLDRATELVEDLEKKLQRELLRQYGIVGGGTSGPPPAADGPFYWCPVDPPRSYVDDFGAPRVGHTHQGNDIFAPEGTPIRAPFAGMAEESYNSLGGLSVHVYASANADYVYNAHLVRYAGVDGQQVPPGSIIGFVGTTGNAAGTPPHDHFEYHPGGGSAVSPYVYLNEVCGVGGQGF